MYVQVVTSAPLAAYLIEGNARVRKDESEAFVHAHFHHPDVFMALTPEEAREIAREFTRAANEADVAYAALTATPEEAITQ